MSDQTVRIYVSEVIITVPSNPGTDEQSEETGDHSQDNDLHDKGRIIVVMRRFLSFFFTNLIQ